LEEWRGGPYGLAAAQQAFIKAHGEEQAPPLPPGWTSEMDDATGTMFYEQTKTGRRTWVRPGFRPPPVMSGAGGPMRGPPHAASTFSRGPLPGNFRSNSFNNNTLPPTNFPPPPGSGVPPISAPLMGVPPPQFSRPPPVGLPPPSFAPPGSAPPASMGQFQQPPPGPPPQFMPPPGTAPPHY